MWATMFFVILTNVNFTEDMEDGMPMDEQMTVELSSHSQPVKEDTIMTTDILFRMLE
jgi:hypothetical protein